MSPARLRALCAGIVIALAMAGAPRSAWAQGGLDAQRQAELEGVGIEEHLGKTIPMDATFTDSTGKTVRLGDYFNQGKPVIVNFVYYECPMLCTLSLNGTSDVLKQLEFTPGDQFNLVTISFNHKEDAELAAGKKASYIKELGKPEAADGWHFLVGDEQNIRKATEATGFMFKWVPEQEQYAHGAALFVMTPDGRFSQTLKGIAYDAKTLRLALVEASGGKIGSVSEQLLMYCFSYDPDTGRYGPAAIKIMRLGGAMTVVVLALTILAYRLNEKRRLRKSNRNHAQPDAA
ncbi:SCO family protein [Planctomycetales bacterium ZRK34]|nr:SCO family protein [Planctomycetales bacterium ZRK34]